MDYLRSSAEIKSAIAKLYCGDGSKWAIVAFVGYGALDQLPSGVRNLNVICWPKAGATHPDGIRRLLKAGVKVYFCNRLHSKIYWAEKLGVIIGSANLSKNALAGSNQHEFAAHIDDKDFEIQRVISKLKYKEVNAASLRALDIAHVAAPSKDPDSDEGQNIEAPSFLEASGHALPKRWKLVTWNLNRTKDENERLRSKVQEISEGRSWTNDNDVESDSFQAGDFVLQVRTNEDGQIERQGCKWLRVDFVAKSRKQLIIVQIKPISEGTQPPFALDKGFKKYFKEAFNGLGLDQITDRTATVKSDFIAELERKIKSGIGRDQ